MTPVDARLKFAVEFAQMDLNRFRARDWQLLREKIDAFLLPGRVEKMEREKGIFVFPMPLLNVSRPDQPRIPQEFTEEHFRNLQKDTHVLLGGLMNHPTQVIEGEV